MWCTRLILQRKIARYQSSSCVSSIFTVELHRLSQVSSYQRPDASYYFCLGNNPSKNLSTFLYTAPIESPRAMVTKPSPPNMASRRISASAVGMPPRFMFLLAAWDSRFWRSSRSFFCCFRHCSRVSP